MILLHSGSLQERTGLAFKNAFLHKLDAVSAVSRPAHMHITPPPPAPSRSVAVPTEISSAKTSL